ncbi:hypothetical protein RUND412_009835 [Rhizina undulata]
MSHASSTPISAADHSRNRSMSSSSLNSANSENEYRTVYSGTSNTSVADSNDNGCVKGKKGLEKAESVLGIGIDAPKHHGKRPQRPDSRFYSGRHPVPKIENLWALRPDRSTAFESKEEADRKRKIEEHSEVVFDPIAGKDVKICDAKYFPPVEIEKTRLDIYPPSYWIAYMEEVSHSFNI